MLGVHDLEDCGSFGGSDRFACFCLLRLKGSCACR